MDDERTYFERKLPHYQPHGVTYFITFRLTNSLPAEVVQQLKEERDLELQRVGQDRILPDNVKKSTAGQDKILPDNTKKSTAGQDRILSDIAKKSSAGQDKILSDNAKKSTAGQDKILSYNIQKKYFKKYDEYLDRVGHGPHWLRNKAIAKVIADTLHYWDGKRYELICYCIMPNHVHVVLSPKEAHVGQFDKLSYSLSRLLHSIKRHTAREANKIICRTGKFWQHESYDHVVRKGDELEKIIWHVLNNPVKAGLVKNWENWKWSYVKNDFI